ncbi:MAG: hypothetical protein Q7T00_07645 [Rugosibacter sp.]|nr:hypothetical protein [Rugosibacter sp.]
MNLRAIAVQHMKAYRRLASADFSHGSFETPVTVGFKSGFHKAGMLVA